MNSTFGKGMEAPLQSADELMSPGLLAAINQLEIQSRRALLGKLHGERRSRKRGFSIDFADHRPYVAGDDLRFVDWNVYARLDSLFMKLYLDEEDLGVLLVLDSTASMNWGVPSKWNWTRRLAMALGSIALAGQHRVSLASCAGNQIEQIRDLRGRSRASEMAAWLLNRRVGGAPTEGSFLETFVHHGPVQRGRGVVIILSDFLDAADPLAALRQIAVHGHDLHCVQVLSPQEVDPAGHGMTGDLRLEDEEGGPSREVTVTPGLLEAYRARLEQRVAGLRSAAGYCGGTSSTVRTDTAVEDVLLQELRQGGLIR